MNRMFFAVSAALLVSTGLVFANDIVPGSDTYVRDQQTSSDTSVVLGSRNTGNAYGYPSVNAERHTLASDRADDRAIDRAAGSATVASSGTIVPGSDSF